METVLIVGLGEVGLSLHRLFIKNKNFKTFGIDKIKEKWSTFPKPPRPVNYMHICFPYNQNFTPSTISLIETFTPKLTIINSTVPPGTTFYIEEITKSNIVHSPIRGRHRPEKDLTSDLKRWVKYIGGKPESCKLAEIHFKKLGLKTKILGTSTETELTKLISTTYFAWMIAFWQETHRISSSNNTDLTKIIEMTFDDHKVEHNKPVFYPDIIGGHCLLPNVELLNNNMFNQILISNEQLKQEIQDPKIQTEINNIKFLLQNENLKGENQNVQK